MTLYIAFVGLDRANVNTERAKQLQIRMNILGFSNSIAGMTDAINVGENFALPKGFYTYDTTDENVSGARTIFRTQIVNICRELNIEEADVIVIQVENMTWLLRPIGDVEGIQPI